MSKGVIEKLTSRTAKVLLCVILPVVLLVAALYSPMLQRVYVAYALKAISSPDGMEITVGAFSLRPPLRLSVDDLEVRQKGDTMVTAGRVDIAVALMPLLSGRIESRAIDLKDIFFKTGAPDSADYVRARLASASLRHAHVDLGSHKVDAREIGLSGGRVSIALRPDTTSSPSSEVDWRIAVGHISLDDIDVGMTMLTDTITNAADSIAARLTALSLDDGRIDLKTKEVTVGEVDIDLARALYAAAGAVPAKGFDPSYIEVTNAFARIDSIRNCGSDLAAVVDTISLNERSGLWLRASGRLAIDSASIAAHNLLVDANASHIAADAFYTLTGPAVDQKVDARLRAAIAPADIALIAPSAAPMMASLPPGRTIDIDADIRGTMADLSTIHASASMRHAWHIDLDGSLADEAAASRPDSIPARLNDLRGRLHLNGNVTDGRMFASILGNDRSATPSVALRGLVTVDRGLIDADLNATTPDGRMALDGAWNNSAEGYRLDFSADRFPMGGFMPRLGVGDVTARIHVDGHGLDPMKPTTAINADIDIVDITYMRNRLTDTSLTAHLADGRALLSLVSENPVADLSLAAAGNLTGEAYSWNATADIRHIDLKALGITDSITTAAGTINAAVDLRPADAALNANVDVEQFNVVIGSDRFYGSDLNARLASTDSTVNASLDNHDLHLSFDARNLAPEPAPRRKPDAFGVFDRLTSRLSAAADTINRMMALQQVDVMPLQQALPDMTISLTAGTDNILRRYLSESGTSFNSLNLNASTDSILQLTATVDGLTSGSMTFDTVNLDLKQKAHYLTYHLKVDNRPGTFDDFAHINANGYLGDNKLMLFVRQQNIDRQTGYRFGATVALVDSTATLRIVPYNPVIGYKDWTVNADNFISYGLANHHFDANFEMSSAESRVHIFTRNDSTDTHEHCSELTVQIDNVKIEDWLQVSPFAPAIKGNLSANADISLQPDKITGRGNVEFADFFYNRRRVGTLDLDFDLATSAGGALMASTSLAVDQVRVMQARGALNDTTRTEPFNLDLELTSFPLRIANPFLQPAAGLDGYLNGKMDVTGSLSSPRLDGYLAFDSARIDVGMLGSSFTFSDSKIAVDSSVIRFDNFAIYGLNDNPLTINGSVDINNLSRMGLDVALNADNMQIVGANKRRGVDIYGRAFISLAATAKGTTQFVNANARLTVREGTNVTYILPAATTELASLSDNDMVRFVNFADSTAVEHADSVTMPSTIINLNAQLVVNQGSTIGVDLSADGTNRVQVQANGSVDFTLNPMGDTRTVGRLNIPAGFVRYSPPLMSEKLFRFEEGSYISFTGDMANPQLNITAVDRMRANVTQEGQNSRLINFDVILRATGSPTDLDVAFDLKTDDDISVENELQSMTAAQRANQAMNLLLYNTYTGPGTKADASLTGNPLYAFLESTLNSWMANNIHGVDISFGIDQYKRTTDGSQSMTTNYSYQVSKSLFDDRFKIVVGGNYSTDANADENFSQNLVSDISFEYMLNAQGSMYVRLFRHTGFESILEGEVTQTGVGFVLRRKVNSLRSLFRSGRRHRKQSPQMPQSAPMPSSAQMPSSPQSPTESK